MKGFTSPPSFRDAPLGAGPESITTIVSMDSGLVLRTPRNDERVGCDALKMQPGGQISKILSSLPAKNIPLNPSGKSALSVRPISSRQEGRSRSSRNVGRDAVDADVPLTNGM